MKNKKKLRSKQKALRAIEKPVSENTPAADEEPLQFTAGPLQHSSSILEI